MSPLLHLKFPLIAIGVRIARLLVSSKCNPLSTKQIGLAAAEAANRKILKHSAAVNRRDHQFIPFALETTGHFDRGAKQLINILKETLPFAYKLNFIRDMYGAVSTALAEYRAEVLINTLTNAKTRK